MASWSDVADAASAVVALGCLASATGHHFHSPAVPTTGKLFRDSKGEATEESKAACSDAASRSAISASVAAGVSVALYNTYSDRGAPLTWHQILTWVILSLQAIILSRQSSLDRRYANGSLLALSALLAVPSFAFWLAWPELAALLAVAAAALSIPRSPQLFHHGQPVDQELSASVLGRLLFAWGPFRRDGTLLKGSVSLDNLPVVGHAIRIRTQKDLFRARAGPSDRLWLQLLKTFFPTLTLQWLLVILDAVFQFGGGYALFKLLGCLEQPVEPTVAACVWAWTAGLGVSLVAQTLASSWVVWVTQLKLQIVIEGLLKSFVFDKTTRRRLIVEKNTSSVGKDEELSLTEMITTDCMEVASFCAHSHHILLAVVKVFLDTAYLAQLLGFKSILVGATASAMLIPLSNKLSEWHHTARASRSKAHSALSNHISEALQGLRHIRLSSTSNFWQKRLADSRDHELQEMWATGVALALLNTVVNLGPILLASLSLSVYSYSAGNPSSSVAFLSLSLLSNLYAVFRRLPSHVADLRVSWASCERLERYFAEPEQVKAAQVGTGVELEKAAISWNGLSYAEHPSAAFSLCDIDLKFPKGQLSIVTGSTGTGKSLLLSAILEEANLDSGALFLPPVSELLVEKNAEILPGTKALVSQPPWISDCTIKDNILFGSSYNESRYQQVLHSCALDQDIATLPKGDQTVAGLGGAMLSGGQKWRVALARAFYSSAEIILLDDVLSAVDAIVARRICERLLMGDLAKGRTIIMFTNSPGNCLAAAAYHATVQDGTITGCVPKPALPKQVDSSVPLESTQADTVAQREELATDSPPSTPGEATNMTTMELLTAYIWASGGIISLVIGVLVTLASRAAANGSSWWLTRWTSQQGTDDSSTSYNIGVYLALSVAAGVATEARSLILLGISIGASRSLFQRLMHSMLHAPLSWIDSMPLGEMIQALEVDLHNLDYRTTKSLHNLLGNIMHLLFIIGTSFFATSHTFVFAIVILVAYARVANQHLTISAQLFKLIDSSMRPLLEHTTSVASGITTIRAFGRTGDYVEQMNDLLDMSAKLGLHLILGQRWLDVRLGIIEAAFVTVTAAALVYQRENAAQAGLIITLALQLKAVLNGSVSSFNFADILSAKLGRVIGLAQMDTENEDGALPPAGWPSCGAVEVTDLAVRYSASAAPAIQEVSFSVQPQQRLGVVGRTGAGKTSLTNALMRFVQPSSGCILIDGVDIATLQLPKLREAVGLIPQDPFLFSGTLRSNIDPDGIHTDSACLAALGRVHLGTKFASLDVEMQAGGKNLSYGQRQLLCLARALLAKCRVLILDEATSAVDADVDAAVQKVIREDFAEATIIVVAHRLLTVADFDNILVMSEGKVAEYGPPARLMEQKGLFYDMVRGSSDADKIRAMIGSK